MNESSSNHPCCIVKPLSRDRIQRRAEPDSIAEGNTIGGLFTSDDFGGPEVGKLGFEYFNPIVQTRIRAKFQTVTS